MKRGQFILLGFLLIHAAQAETTPPVIDMHLHALKFDQQGPPPLAMCTPHKEIPVWDQTLSYPEAFMGFYKNPHCDDPIWSPMSDDELLQRSLADMEAHNVYGVLSGLQPQVDTWTAAAPGRFMRGFWFSLDDTTPTPAELATLHEQNRVEVVAEIVTQYQGILPTDPRLEPYWAMMEANDIPAGIHIGPGPPGVIYLGSGDYRASMHSALTIEDVLVRHPKLRVYIMHAGYPMLDDLLALLHAHPQVHVEVGIIVYAMPRKSFYGYLEGIFDAGFGKRVMFGSDQMVWPETIGRSIDVINAAPFLTGEQKRDVLFNNAARFLRLSEQEIARMHAGD